MKFTVLSLFPEIIDTYFASSIMGKACKRGLVQYQSIYIRDFAFDKHKTCDDAPYGGGPGMLLMPEPLARSLESVGVRKKALGESGGDAPVSDREPPERANKKVIYLSPSGKLFNQKLACQLAKEEELVLICGHYEGIDQRIIDLYVDEEISIGDYVLSSGEVAALALIDSIFRLIDDVINSASLKEESFSLDTPLLEYPQWTRPEIFEGIAVPEILLSGHHENIRKWRLEQSLKKTRQMRPDLGRAGNPPSLPPLWDWGLGTRD